MDDSKDTMVKSASEIGMLLKQLPPDHQLFVLNTIDFFLLNQKEKKRDGRKKEGAAGDVLQ